MRRLIVFLLLIMPSLVSAQSSNIGTFFSTNFAKAEVLYNQFAYRNALHLYLVVAEEDAGNDVLWQRIADCHFHLGNIDEAEEWYAKLAFRPDGDLKYKYQYAQILSLQGKYAEAQKWFGSSLLNGMQDPRAASKLQFFHLLPYHLRDSALYDIQLEPYNSDQSDFAPQFFREGVVFVSARNHDLFVKRQSLSAMNDDEAMLNVFYYSGDSATADVNLFYSRDLNSPYHDGPLAIYADGRRIVFSRNNMHGRKAIRHSGKVNLNLYFAEINIRNEVVAMEKFPFNSDTFSIAHPWISEDGNTLLFSSDMPQSQGGADIYKSVRQHGRWQMPQNLGPGVNSAGDEYYPFLANDSTLFFASNGHGGLGGLDTYVSYRRVAAFAPAVNLGFPLNTSRDDFSFVLDKSGRNGLFASNRRGTMGDDDIYRVAVKKFFLHGRVQEYTMSNEGISRASVILKEKGRGVIDSVHTDVDGNFQFDLAFDQEYVISASKRGYRWIHDPSFTTKSKIVGYDTLIIPLAKHFLSVKGSVYSNESQSKLSEATIIIEDITDALIDSVMTDSTGSYNYQVESAKHYRIVAKKTGFLPKELMLNTDGLFEKELVNDFLLEEKFLDKVVIQFDFGKADLRANELEKLENIYSLLTRRPEAQLLVSAFADAKGSKEYNQTLSDKRVISIVKFFTSRGISRGRIEGKGFGETLLLKPCSDGVECDEVEHSFNRRAEIKVR